MSKNLYKTYAASPSKSPERSPNSAIRSPLTKTVSKSDHGRTLEDRIKGLIEDNQKLNYLLEEKDRTRKASDLEHEQKIAKLIKENEHLSNMHQKSLLTIQELQHQNSERERMADDIKEKNSDDVVKQLKKENLRLISTIKEQSREIEQLRAKLISSEGLQADLNNLHLKVINLEYENQELRESGKFDKNSRFSQRDTEGQLAMGMQRFPDCLKVQQLESEVDKLNTIIDDWKKRYEEAQSRVESLELEMKQISKSNVEAADLIEENQKLTQIIAEKSRELDLFQNDTRESAKQLRNEISDLKERNKELAARLEEAQTELKNSNHFNSEELRGGNNASYKRALEELGEARYQILEHERRNENLKKENEKLKKNLNELTDQIERYKQKNEETWEIREKLANLSHEITRLNEQLTTSQKEKEFLKHNLERLTREKDRQISRLQEENGRMRDDLSRNENLESELASKRQDLQDDQVRIQKLEGRVKELMQEKEYLREVLSQQSDEMQELRQIKDSVPSLESKLHSVMKENEELTMKFDRYRLEADKLRAQAEFVSELQEKLDQSSNDCIEMRTYIQELQRQVDRYRIEAQKVPGMQNTIDDLTSTNRELVNQIEYQRDELTSLSSRVNRQNDLDEKIQLLEEKLIQANIAKEKMSELYNRKEMELDELRAKTINEKDQKLKLQEEFECEIQELQKKIVQVTNEKQKLESNLMREIQSQKEQIKEQLRDLEMYKDINKNQYKELQNYKDLIKNQIKELEDHKETMRIQQTELQVSKEKEKRIQAQLEENEEILRNLTYDNKVLGCNLENAQKEIEKLQARNTDLENLNRKINGLQTELAAQGEEKERLERINADLRKQLQSLEEQCRRTQKENKFTQEDLEKATLELLEKEKLIADLEAQKAETEQKLLESDEAIHELEPKLLELEEVYNKELKENERLNSFILELQKENQAFKAQSGSVPQLQKRLSYLQNDNESLTKMLGELQKELEKLRPIAETIQELDKRVQSLQQENKNLNRMLQERDKENEALHENQRKKLSIIDQNHEAQHRETEEIKYILKNKEQEYERLQRANESLKLEIGDFKRVIDNLSKDNKQLTMKLREYESVKTRKQTFESELETGLDEEPSTRIRTFDSPKSSSLGRHKLQISAAKYEALTTQLADSEKEIKNLRSSISEIVKKTEQKYQNMISELNARIQQLEEENKRLREISTPSKRSHSSIGRETSSAGPKRGVKDERLEQLEDVTKENERLKAAIKEYSIQTEELRARITELERDDHPLPVFGSRKHTAEKESDRVAGRLKDQFAAKDEEIGLLKRKLKGFQGGTDLTFASNSESQQAINSLIAENGRLNNLLKERLEELEKIKSIINQSDQFSSRIERTQSRDRLDSRRETGVNIFLKGTM